MKILRIIDDRDLMGAKFPMWYGFAYRKFEVRQTVVAIIPFNLFIRWAYQVYWRVYSWLKSDGWRDKLDTAYWKGFNDGAEDRQTHFDRMRGVFWEGKA